MKCPGCQITVELTWGRYFKTLRSRFKCPNCSTIFTLKHTWQYHLYVLSWAAITAAFTAGSIYFGLGRKYFYPGIFILVVIYWCIDKALENKLATKQV
jgi:hypothetical protein